MEDMINLKRLRLRKGLSQSQLAEKAQINVRTLQYYEQGVKNINKIALDSAYRISQVLNCKMSDLLEDIE